MNVTVAEFLKKGFKFVVDDFGGLLDEFTIQGINSGDCHFSISKKGCFTFKFDNSSEINFPLAWRENKGEMPCDGELWVDVKFDTGKEYHELLMAREFYFGETSSITHWRPSIKNWEKEEVMENQNIELENDALKKMEEGKSNFHSLDDARGILKSRREANRERTGKENQIEKAIRESEVAMITMPTTAEGKRKLAAQLLDEAIEMENSQRIQKHAEKATQEMIDAGLIDESDRADVYQSHLEFYADMEIF